MRKRSSEDVALAANWGYKVDIVDMTLASPALQAADTTPTPNAAVFKSNQLVLT